MNPRSIALQRELTEFPPSRKTKPVLGIVVGIEVRSTILDFATAGNAIRSRSGKIGRAIRQRLRRPSKGRLSNNNQNEQRHRHTECRSTEKGFHEVPPGLV